MRTKEKDEIQVPRSVQQSIPIKMISEDGIFQLSNGAFSFVWKFDNINYSIASDDDQEIMFIKYCALLNSFDAEADNKITIFNRRMPKTEFEQNILYKINGDAYDPYRKEMNNILLDEAAKTDNLFSERYITTTIRRKTLHEARAFFSRVNADMVKYFKEISQNCMIMPLNAEERLRVYHDFFRAGEEHNYTFDIHAAMRHGVSFKDQICPDSLVYERDYFKMGNRFGRVLFVRDYPSFLRDTILKELTDMRENMLLSIDVQSVPTDTAVKRVENKLLSVETDITRWQQRMNEKGNFTTTVPYDRDKMRSEIKEYLDDLQNRDQRMMLVTLTVCHVATSKEQLDLDTESLMAVARKHLCGLGRLYYQQEDGLNTVIPYGLRKISAQRTLTTESTAVLLPFSVQELYQSHGCWYGSNAVSKNLIMCDRKSYLNGNGYICGTSGSGKSFMTKIEIVNVALSTTDDIIIIDPDQEYAALVRELGGEVIVVSPDSDTHINALGSLMIHKDINDPIRLKSDFALSLCEQAREDEPITSAERSMIDRCIKKIYAPYIGKEEDSENVTLVDFNEALHAQNDPIAEKLAIDLEIFTTGSLNTFAHKTNVNPNARIVCYDIKNLGQNLKPLGLLIIFDAIARRMNDNRRLHGKFSRVYFDEIQELYKYKYSAKLLEEHWRQARKYGGLMTGITQNVEPVLESDVGRVMLSNSEFLIMLAQSKSDREALASLLSIAETQLSYLSGKNVGTGLIRAGGCLVPFNCDFPKSSKLYSLMSTKPGES